MVKTDAKRNVVHRALLWASPSDLALLCTKGSVEERLKMSAAESAQRCTCGLTKAFRKTGKAGSHVHAITEGDWSRAGPFSDQTQRWCPAPGPCGSQVAADRNRVTTRQPPGWRALDDVLVLRRHGDTGALTSARQHGAAAVADFQDSWNRPAGKKSTKAVGPVRMAPRGATLATSTTRLYVFCPACPS